MKKCMRISEHLTTARITKAYVITDHMTDSSYIILMELEDCSMTWQLIKMMVLTKYQFD